MTITKPNPGDPGWTGPAQASVVIGEIIDAINASVDSAAYTIYQSGGVTYARNGLTGDVDFSGIEPGAVFQSVFTALDPGGGTVKVRGATYNWGSVPKLPNNTTGWIKLIGEGQVTINLTSTGRRFLDFDRQSPGDTFNFFLIEGFTVNASNLATLTGTQHIVLGTFQNPTTISGQDVNFDNIVIRRIRTTNVATANKATRHYLNVMINTFVTNNATQYRMTNILVEQCQFDGGNYGVGLVGSSQSGFLDNPDIWMDNIVVRDIVHDTNIPPTSSSSFANVHVGGRAKGGTCWVYDIIGKNSWDVGVEVDNFQTAFVHDVHLEDWYGFGVAITDFLAVPNLPSQVYYISNIAGYRSTARWSPSATALIGMNQAKDILNVDQQFGRVIVNNIFYYRKGSNLDLGSLAGDLIELKLPMKEFSLTNATYWAGTLTHGIASSIFDRVIFVYPTHSDGSPDVTNHIERLVLRNLDFRVMNSTFDVGSPILEFTGVYISGLIDSFLIDNMRFEMDVTNLASGSPKGIDLGQAGATTTQGFIRGLQMITTLPGSSRAITIQDTTKLTIPVNTGIWVTDSDFSGMQGTPTEISHPGAADNKDQVFVDNNKWVIFPKVAYAKTVTSTTINQYLDGWDGTFVLHGGIVSLVEISRDNVNWYTIGIATNMAWPMHHGEYWRVTFSSPPALHIFPEN